ncbi:SGNH hydrolase-type esterase domain-containing protein [Xylariaceae sp. FL0804]|nr:SGNH hydrolase-type esterase domain-containing protein [Xylariaceae sp. FL0804]
MWSRIVAPALALAAAAGLVDGTILQNGQVRITDYPDTRIADWNNASAAGFRTYDAGAAELSYKGRWDSKHVSWWSAPGLIFGFTGSSVAVTFGDLTSEGVLVAWRVGGEDWQLTNASAGATHLLVTPADAGVNYTYPLDPLTFELRVTNWAYGVQIDSVHVAAGESLVAVPNYNRTIEFIGDSLSAGDYATYEGLSSFAWLLQLRHGTGAGFGDTEYFVTAYPGICVSDQDCWGNLRGQSHQWFYTSDTSYRATEIWGDNPEPWDFSKQPTPSIVVINLGTNDNNVANNVSTSTFVESYKRLIEGVHGKYPDAQIIVMELWMGFYAYGNSYAQDQGYYQEIKDIVAYFNSPAYLSRPVVWDAVTNSTRALNATSAPFVHYFSTQGILQHNDIGPEYHPTDVGAVKVASHLMQFIKLTFGWDMLATGPEIQHDTLYWNDEGSY